MLGDHREKPLPGQGNGQYKQNSFNDGDKRHPVKRDHVNGASGHARRSLRLQFIINIILK